MGVVLVGDDGGERSDDALRLSAVLAPLLGADEIRVRVVPDHENPGVDPATSASERPVLIERGRSPARVLYEIAEAREAVMLVLASSHRAGVGQILPGGVANRLLQGGPCPIAVAPLGYGERERDEPRVVGVAFDGSTESHRALSLAADLATAAAATLRVITVYPAPAPSESLPGGSTSSYSLLQDSLRDAVQALPNSLRAEPRLRTDGDPADLLAAESELGVDLMIMGSRGYGPLGSVFLGSVSEQLMRRAACPVIVVPRGAIREQVAN
jgi:nucleotide-binding universal stress UspA family protein